MRTYKESIKKRGMQEFKIMHPLYNYRLGLFKLVALAIAHRCTN
jgi:hypothetical protein